MNREEYEKRRRTIENEYLAKLASLEADWVEAHPEEVMARGLASGSSWDRLRHVIATFHQDFVLDDIGPRYHQLFPGIHVPANQSIGRLLGEMVYDNGELELIKNAPGTTKAIYRFANRDEASDGKEEAQ